MIVLMMERVPVGLRGELSRWMIEPKANVFVGKMSAMVRDKLWETACAKSKGGAALMIFPARTEQGFAIRTHGDTSRKIVDYDGLLLVRIPKGEATKAKKAPRATKEAPLSSETLPTKVE